MEGHPGTKADRTGAGLQQENSVSGWIKRTNEWARHHPWRAAATTAVFLFAVLTIFGVLVFDRGIGFEAAVAAAYAVTFSLITGTVNAYRRRRDRA